MQIRSPVSLPQNDPGNYYQQTWLPCTQNETIHHYMSRLRFPTSFRGLCEQWRALGKPHLVNLQYPEGLQYGISSGVPQNLEVLSSLQEIMTLSIFAGYMRENIIPTPRPFSEIASHMHIYCSIKVELAHKMYQFTREQQDTAYERQWRALQEDFHHDRAFCQSLARHDCIGYLLYGEVYDLTRENISQRYHQFQLSSPRNKYQFLPSDLLGGVLSATLPNHARFQQVPMGMPSHSSSMSMTSNSNSVISNNHTNSGIYSNHNQDGSTPFNAMHNRPSLNSSIVQLGSSSFNSPPLNQYNEESSLSPEVGTPLSIHQGFMAGSSAWQPPQQQRRSIYDGQDENSPTSGFFSERPILRNLSSTSTSSNSIHMLEANSNIHSSPNPQNSESRAEQNRQKSKRHYERKKLQRSLLYDLVVKMENTMQYLMEHRKGHLPVCQAMHEALTTILPTPEFLIPASSSASQSPQQPVRETTANEKKKLNKKVQNHLESQRITQISQAARILHPNNFGQSSFNVPIDSSNEQGQSTGGGGGGGGSNRIDGNYSRQLISSSTQILLSQTQEEVESIHQSIIFEPQDAFLLSWLHMRPNWEELVAAENRLSKGDDKPIARLITYLISASAPSHNTAGPSSANQTHAQNHFQNYDGRMD